MNEKENKYLSLKAAAELYGYTRDHLGLMIRQGKLNGMKLGSYYVVTNEWMLQYIKNFADPSHSTSKNKMSNRFLTEALAAAQNLKNPNISNSIPLNEEHKNDLERKLSEELSLLSIIKKDPEEIKKETYIDTVKKLSNFEDSKLKLVNEHTYVILPIRKMNSNEVEDILNRTPLNKEIKKDY
ncbi:MAG: hypothetical protein AAB648_00740 [Patescibacteria group bacterium]